MSSSILSKSLPFPKPSLALFQSVGRLRTWLYLGLFASLLQPVPAQPAPKFEDYIKQSQAFFNEGKLPEALTALQAAGRLEPNRYEASVLAALVLHKAGRLPEAQEALAAARKLAPADKAASLDAIAKVIAAPVSPAPTATNPSGQSPDQRRRFSALTLIIEDAAKATELGGRRKFLGEFLEKSAPYVRDFPDDGKVWTMRAVACVELNYEMSGILAARALSRLKLTESADPKIVRLVGNLERKGWFNAKTDSEIAADKFGRHRDLAPPPPDARWTNSLNMGFVPAAGVWFSIYETRIEDYLAFVRATGRNWLPPHWQEIRHPAVWVSWDDAQAFCRWLTDKERSEKRILSSQFYRLPTDAEWSEAVGLPVESGASPAEKDSNIANVYPWGSSWPPPKGSGNYVESFGIDSYPRTAPVGSFSANKFGLFDMGGNVWEWCESYYGGSGKDSGARVLRGDSWSNVGPEIMWSSFRGKFMAGTRLINIGFRCVLAVGASSP